MTTSDPALQALHRYKEAVYARDVDALVALYDEQVRIFDTWGAWSLSGLGAWRESVEAWFGSLGEERVVVEFEDVQTHVAGTLAHVTAFARFSAVDAAGNTLRFLHNRFSAVLAERSHGWKIVHEHTSSPADPKTLKITLRR